jgi:hypothetical protein
MPKKFLDANGVAYLASLLDNYPDNEILGTVINAIQEALDEKNEILGLSVDAQGYICQTVEVNDSAGSN